MLADVLAPDSAKWLAGIVLITKWDLLAANDLEYIFIEQKLLLWNDLRSPGLLDTFRVNIASICSTKREWYPIIALVW